MREIKFRMWDLENKVMIDGDSLAFEEYSPISHLLTQEGTMQYTGLKDKNGKEIYEGDIAKQIEEDEVGIVEWENEPPGFLLICKNEKWLLSTKRIEVIGNVYEHPHLLETPKASVPTE